tara:strand:+ start:40 stop:843 length:804 start_codon:yes stop_codon:yes gene_type:complete
MLLAIVNKGLFIVMSLDITVINIPTAEIGQKLEAMILEPLLKKEVDRSYPVRALIKLPAVNREFKMQKTILTTLLIFSSSIAAHDLPNTFEAGQPIVASEVNENFAELKNEIESIKSQLNIMQSENNGRAFVGLTQQKTKGAANFSIDNGQNWYRGGRAMDKRCDIEFAGSKMCTYLELESSGTDDLLSVKEYAWRAPSKIVTNQSGKIVDPGIESSNYSDPWMYSCNNWISESSSHHGLIIKATELSMSLDDHAPCHESRSIACCK